MSKGKFDKFSNLRHLLSTSSNIVVPNVGEVSLFILSLDWLSFCKVGKRSDSLFSEWRPFVAIYVPQWMTVSWATIQYSAGSVSMTLNSTDLGEVDLVRVRFDWFGPSATVRRGAVRDGAED